VRRGPLLAAAIAVAAAAPLLVLAASARNRAAAPEAEVELTEREARLVPAGEGRRWAVLRLDWNRFDPDARKDAGWFGRARLDALGFDTRLPADDPGASAFYGWQPARVAFVALELDGPAAAADDDAFPHPRETRSRLHAVDVDRDARALRARHPDRSRVLVVRAVVSAACRGRWDPSTRTLSPPFLEGRIERLLVEEVHVPKERRALLDALVSGEPRSAGAGGPPREAGHRKSANGPPRYRVLIRTGSRFEPWVAEVLPIAP
jgi:hypothetical protein